MAFSPNSYNLEKILPDLLIGAALIPGTKVPCLATKKTLKLMREGSVIVDVAVDQRGCVETTHPTTQDDPVFEVDGVIHYCAVNMTGADPKTSILVLTNATLPYVLRVANKRYKHTLREDAALAKGLNLVNGKLTYRKVAKAHNLPFLSIEEALN